MSLTTIQMARMSKLLDEALPLDEPGRRRWLEELSPADRDLALALREALLGSGAGSGRRPRLTLFGGRRGRFERDERLAAGRQRRARIS